MFLINPSPENTHIKFWHQITFPERLCSEKLSKMYLKFNTVPIIPKLKV